jgi:putative SOS response-associated peptidase YedK
MRVVRLKEYWFTVLAVSSLACFLATMCGRYALAQEHEALRIRFGFSEESAPAFTHSPRFNIAPTQIAPIITNGQEMKLRAMRWGLIPHWAKDAAIGNSLINARADTVAEKPSFRDSFKKRRCLVPATGFFEWKKEPLSKSKQPFFIGARNRDIFSFAGLWSLWKNPETAEEMLSYTILTTEPNELMREIHNRMPVMLPAEREKDWLDLASSPGLLRELLAPYPAELMDAFPVSKVVNSPRNDSPACIAPL